MIGFGKTHMAAEIFAELHGKVPVIIIDGKPGWEVTYPGAPAGEILARHGLDPDPPRCWSCGHPFDAGCECTCCYDDHSEAPDPDDYPEWNLSG